MYEDAEEVDEDLDEKEKEGGSWNKKTRSYRGERRQEIKRSKWSGRFRKWKMRRMKMKRKQRRMQRRKRWRRGMGEEEGEDELQEGGDRKTREEDDQGIKGRGG